MTPRVILRPSVVEDMEAQANYLLRHSPASADRFLENCMTDFHRLAAMPGMGAKREFRNPKAQGIRSWPMSGFPNHLIFYRPIDGGIEVLRVIHGARDIDAIFDPKE